MGDEDESAMTASEVEAARVSKLEQALAYVELKLTQFVSWIRVSGLVSEDSATDLQERLLIDYARSQDLGGRRHDLRQLQ